MNKCKCGHYKQSHYGSGRGKCKWCDCSKFREVKDYAKKEQDQEA